MDGTLPDARLRNRHLERLAIRLGDLYGKIERLSLNMHQWQRQISKVDEYVVVRHRWIVQAEAEISQLKSHASALEDEYLILNGEE